MKLFLAALIVFVLAVLAMAVGLLISNRRLRGTCGGMAGLRDKEGNIACEACTAPSEQCAGPDDDTGAERDDESASTPASAARPETSETR